jgi:hypothetical protein
MHKMEYLNFLGTPTLESSTRRDFLKIGATAGMAVAASQFLPSSATWAAATAGTNGRVSLHFDLSEFDPQNKFCLNIVRSASHKAILQRHTAQSRAVFRARIPSLAQVTDRQLTHYLPDVDIADHAVPSFWISSLDDTICGWPGCLDVVSIA